MKTRLSLKDRCSVEWQVLMWSRNEIGPGMTLRAENSRWARNEQAAGKNALTLGSSFTNRPTDGIGAGGTAAPFPREC